MISVQVKDFIPYSPTIWTKIQSEEFASSHQSCWKNSSCCSEEFRDYQIIHSIRMRSANLHDAGSHKWLILLFVMCALPWDAGANTRAVLSVVDFSPYAYSCEISTYGNNLDRDMVYRAILMRPPEDPQLCELPTIVLHDNSNITLSGDIRTPLALLVSLGGCDVYTKTDIALQINERVSRSLKYIVFYNNDPDNNDGIVQILPPSPDTGVTVPDDIQRLAFLSVSTSAGVNLMGLIQKYSEATGKSAVFLREGSENWDLAMIVGRPLSEPNNPPPSNIYTNTTSRINSGNFYWFRFILFALLIMSPCCRGAYLWWNGGGRIHFRRNENGRIVGLQYVSPMSYWFVSTGGQEVSTPITDRLTEEEVLALPEIIYKPPPESESKDNHDHGTQEDEVSHCGDLDIIISSGSADATERNKEPVLERAPSVSESIRSDEEQTEHNNCLTSCTTCSICIDEFVAGERIRLLPRCKHAFHTECIMPWLTERQGCCPLCKATVIDDDSDEDTGRDITTEAEATIVTQDGDATERESQEGHLTPFPSETLETVVRISEGGAHAETDEVDASTETRTQR